MGCLHRAAHRGKDTARPYGGALENKRSGRFGARTPAGRLAGGERLPGRRLPSVDAQRAQP